MFIRIDDRLVHGQVVTAWLKQLSAKKVLVADDVAATNTFIGKALKMATPPNVELVLKTVEEGAKEVKLHNEQDLLIVVKSPVSAKKLIEVNPEYNWDLNVGNVGMQAGRKKYANTVYLDDSEYKALKETEELENVNVFIQLVPSQPVSKLK